jgi:hypothetical protein
MALTVPAEDSGMGVAVGGMGVKVGGVDPPVLVELEPQAASNSRHSSSATHLIVFVLMCVFLIMSGLKVFWFCRVLFLKSAPRC